MTPAVENPYVAPLDGTFFLAAAATKPPEILRKKGTRKAAATQTVKIDWKLSAGDLVERDCWPAELDGADVESVFLRSDKQRSVRLG